MGLFDGVFGGNTVRGKGWKLDQKSGQLTINGFIDERAPFRNITDQVRSVTAVSGAKINNGRFLFYDMKNLASADLANLDVSWCFDAGFMFAGCSSLVSLDLSAWELKRLGSADAMFDGCTSLEEIKMGPGWKLGKLEYSNRMFCNCGNLRNLDISDAIPFENSLKKCDQMFAGCGSLQSLDLSKWNMASVTSMRRMFALCTDLKTLNLENWVLDDNADATDAFDRLKRPVEIISDDPVLLPEIYKAQDSNWGGWHILFDEETLVIDSWLTHWDKGDGQGLPPWFRYADFIKHVRCEYGAKAFTCRNLFHGCVYLESINLNNLNTTDVTSFDGMFRYCVSLKRANLNGLNVSKVRSMKDVFSGCTNLSEVNADEWDVSAAEDFTGFFAGCKSLKEVNLYDWKISTAAELDDFFTGCSNLDNIYCMDNMTSGLLWNAYNQCAARDQSLSGHGIKLGSGNWLFDRATGELVIRGHVGDTDYMFSAFANDVLRIRTEKGAKLDNGNMLFAHMKNLKEADLAQLDTTRCTNMRAMFEGCESLVSLDLSNWNVYSVETMEGMFDSCSSLERVRTGKWHPFKLRNTSSMFAGCNALKEISIADWQELRLNLCSKMFAECSSLEHLDLSSMRVWAVKDFSSMFMFCFNLKTLNLGGWMVSQASDFSDMFSDCDHLETLDLSEWKINENADTSGMFDSVSDTLKVFTDDATIKRLLGGRQVVNPEEKPAAAGTVEASKKEELLPKATESYAQTESLMDQEEEDDPELEEETSGTVYSIDPDCCVGCCSCEVACPIGAVSMVGNICVIDQDACISCGTCYASCPVNAITKEDRPEEILPDDEPDPKSLIEEGREAEENGDTDEALDLYQQAAETGDAEAMYALANLYFQEDYLEDADEWAGKAKESGNLPAGTPIDDLILQIENEKLFYAAKDAEEAGNKEEAFRLCRKAAERDDPDCCRLLASYYEDGIGVEPDESESFRYYLKASELGHTGAMVDTAVRLHQGKGVTADEDKALYWAKKAKDSEEWWDSQQKEIDTLIKEIEDNQKAKAAAAPVKEPEKTSDKNKGRRILIADDSAIIRRNIKDVLTKAGFDVVGEAADGIKAVELYRALKPDIVTLDITMPNLDGIGALRKITAIDPEAVCIMCSAMGQKAMVIEAIQAGARDFIVKPLVPEKLLEKVRKYVKNDPAGESSHEDGSGDGSLVRKDPSRMMDASVTGDGKLIGIIGEDDRLLSSRVRETAAKMHLNWRIVDVKEDDAFRKKAPEADYFLVLPRVRRMLNPVHLLYPLAVTDLLPLSLYSEGDPEEIILYIARHLGIDTSELIKEKKTTGTERQTRQKPEQPRIKQDPKPETAASKDENDDKKILVNIFSMTYQEEIKKLLEANEKPKYVYVRDVKRKTMQFEVTNTGGVTDAAAYTEKLIKTQPWGKTIYLTVENSN